MPLQENWPAWISVFVLSVELRSKARASFTAVLFCSDECCEEFTDKLATSGKLELDDLDEDLDVDVDVDVDELDVDDLDFPEDGPKKGDSLLDDDFDINPEDF